MRTVVGVSFVAGVAAFVPSTSVADVVDDYVACVIGNAAVAMHKMETKDADRAQAIAYKICRKPAGLGGDEEEGVGDFVNMQVLRLAGQL